MAKGCLKIFNKFAKYAADYRALRADPRKSSVSGLFGRRTIYNTIGTVLLLACAIAFAALGIAGLDTDSLIVSVLGVIGFAAAGASVLFALFYEVLALMCASRQLRLNKRAVGRVGLILNLVLLVAVIIAAVIILNQI